MNSCPNCRSDHTQRVRRDWWMRLLPRSISIHCSDCGERSIIRANPPLLVVFLPTIAMATPSAPRPNYFPYPVPKVSDLRRFLPAFRGEFLHYD